MKAKFEPQKGAAVDADEAYEDPIALKRIADMADPVLTPASGHIYDRVDIQGWIEQKGTDPVSRTTLSADMLVPGRFVKPIAVDAKTQSDKYMSMFAKMQETIDRNEARAEQDRAKAAQDRQESEARAEQARQESASRFQKFENIIQSLQEENSDLKIKLRALTEENKRLKAGYVNPAYAKLGSDVENKLKKGSSQERHELLEAYAKFVKSSSDDETLRESVNNIEPFLKPEIRNPRYFGCLSWFGVTSETTQVATELRDKINVAKGFTS